MSGYGLHVDGLPLFAAAARRTDPLTSHAAAARLPAFKGQHATAILEALAAGPAGQSGIAERTGLTVAQVSKRLCELRRGGLVERDGEARSASGGREARYRINTTTR
jgi:predicted Rossmann fold nucleotide-binding protein DprA/Smf involved in DNA uptake